MTEGRAEEAKAEGIIRAEPLSHYILDILLEEENKTKKDYETVFILGGYLSGMLLLGLHTWITLRAFF